MARNGHNVAAIENEFKDYGRAFGTGDKARYNAAVRFGELVNEGFYALDDAVKACRLFAEGQAEASGRPMMADLSLNNMASQWKAFASEAAVAKAGELRKGLQEFMTGKKRSEVGKDFYQMAYAANVALKEKPKATINAAFLAERAKPKASNRSTNGAASVDWMATLREAAEHVLAALPTSRKKDIVAKRETLSEVLEMFTA